MGKGVSLAPMQCLISNIKDAKVHLNLNYIHFGKLSNFVVDRMNYIYEN